MGLLGKRKVKNAMEQNEMYETQAGMEDSSERLEKKEQLRAKVQALVSYYEEEKRRNEELTMELERLKAEQQQMQGITGPIGPLNGPAGPMGGPAPGMPPMNGMNPQAGNAAPGGGIPFAQQRPQQNAFQPQPLFPGAPGMPGMPGAPAPGPEFAPPPPQGPQAAGGYTLQSFGAPQPPQGFPPQGFPPQAQPPQRPQPPQQPPFGQPGFPPAQQPFGQPGFGMGMPGGMPGYPPQAPAYPQNDGLMDNIGLVLQTITQVRSKLHQFESIRGYGYPPQPAYVDYDTVALLDKLYDQLGDLSRELMQRQGR